MARSEIVRRLLVLILLSACSGSITTGTGTSTVAPPVVVTPHAAFVVYFARETLVIPALPDHEVMSMPGLLVQDDAEGMNGALTYLTVTNAVPRGASCPCNLTPNACELQIAPLITRVTRGASGLSVRLNNDPLDELAAECACFMSTMDAIAGDYDESECGEGVEDAELIGFLGGQLYVHVTLSEDGCDELSTPTIEVIDAIESAREPRIGTSADELVCIRDVVRDPMALVGARRIECGGPSEDDEEACELCNSDSTNLHYALSRGRLYELAPVFSENEQVTTVGSEPATPESCASINDPCGDATGLPIPAGASFWVANDGASALVHHGDRWLVLVRGRATASVIHVGARGHPIGVRHHLDARPLFEELGARALSAAANRMPIQASVPRDDVACVSDDDCLAAGVCYGFCGVDHLCHDGGCDETHECESEADDAVCDFSSMSCVEPSALRPAEDERLAREDARYARTNPRDHGAGWAARCHAHKTRGRMDEAYAACVRALAARPSPSVRAAALHDLAAIAAHRRRFNEQAAFELYAGFAEEEIEQEASTPSRPRRRRHR